MKNLNIVKNNQICSESLEFISLSTPHLSGDEIHFIKEALDMNWVAPVGPNVDEFEAELSRINKTNAAAAVSSGTAALHLALRLLNVEAGDSVFCSSYTFIASASPILYQQATPVFIDSESDSWCMSPDALHKAFKHAKSSNSLPKAVIVAHIYGQSASMDAILSLCKQYNVPIIEDSAESLGSTYKGKASGTIGDFGIFSFNGNKIITTSGGGALISNNLEAIERARFLATQARSAAPYYLHQELGYNYRLSNISAGIGRAQLSILTKRVEQRRQIYQRYQVGLDSLPIIWQRELENTVSNRWLSSFVIDSTKTSLTPKDIICALARLNIEARYTWNPLHKQPLFAGAEFFYTEEQPVCERLFQNGVCLPSGSNMTFTQQQRVIEALIDIFNNFSR